MNLDPTLILSPNVVGNYRDKTRFCSEFLNLGTLSNYLEPVWEPQFLKGFLFFQMKLVHFSLENWKSHRKMGLLN
jgi:hypothetical protein